MARKKLNIKENQEESTEVEIDLIEIEKMAEIGFTQKDIAYIKGITPETLTRWKKGNIGINQAIEQGKSKGKKKLLDKLMEIVERDEIDNTTLGAAKFLLNAIHGVHEKQERVHTGSLVDSIQEKLNQLGVKAIDKISGS